MKVIANAVVAVLVVLAAANIAVAGQLPPEAGQGRRAGAPNLPPQAVANADVYAMLDLLVMREAQTALQLSDTQFPQFFRLMTGLQNLQRLHRNQRQRLLNELRRLANPTVATVDEAAVGAKLKELDDLETQLSADESRALQQIDQILQVRQRAHFRIFLETMERRKLDLLVRARQGRGAQNPAPNAPVR